MRTVVQNAIDGVVAAAPTTATPPSTDQPPGRGQGTTAPPTPGRGPLRRLLGLRGNHHAPHGHVGRADVAGGGLQVDPYPLRLHG